MLVSQSKKTDAVFEKKAASSFEDSGPTINQPFLLRGKNHPRPLKSNTIKVLGHGKHRQHIIITPRITMHSLYD
jgi:hypothetical protein